MVLDPNTLDDENDPYLAWARAQPLQMLPGELAKPGGLDPLGGSAPPAPPQVPPTGAPAPSGPPVPTKPPGSTLGPKGQHIAMPGAPVGDEVPLGALPPEPPRPDAGTQAIVEQAQLPQNQLPPVDAISGADAHPTVADMTNVGYEQPQVADPNDPNSFASPDAYLAYHQQHAADETLPSMAQAELDQSTAKAVNAMSPEQYAQFKANREGAMIAEQARLAHEAAIADAKRARQAFQIQQDATTKADADTADMVAQAQKLANTQIVADRRGIGGTIRDMTGVFLMGLGGNAEAGLNMVNQRINRDIQVQQDNLANGWKGIDAQKGAIAEQYARHQDLYRAAVTHQVSQYQAQINDIQTQLQLFDPAGAAAIRGRDAIDQLHAAQAQALQAFNQQQFENYIKLGTLQNAQNEFALKAQQRLDKLGGVKKVKPEDVLYTADQLRAQGIAIPMGVELPAAGWSIKQAKLVSETAKTAQEWQKAARENDPQFAADPFTVGEIYDTGGKPLKFRSAEVADKVANSKASFDTISGYLDEMVRLRNANGWSSDLRKSQAWQQAQGALASALLEAKNADQLGALSGSDIELEMKKLTGGVDPTGARDPIPALLSARRRMLDKFNATLRAQAANGVKPKRWEPPNMATLSQAKPLVQGKTSVEQAEGAAVDESDKAKGTRASLVGVLALNPFGPTNEDRARAAEENGPLTPTGLDEASDKQVVATIKAAAKGDADAVQRLADVATSDRESVANAVLSRVRGEDPKVYKQVVAKLPPEQQQALAEGQPQTFTDKFAPKLDPNATFTELSVDQLAEQVHDDPELQKVVSDKALRGKPSEKRKAIDIITRAGGSK